MPTETGEEAIIGHLMSKKKTRIWARLRQVVKHYLRLNQNRQASPPISVLVPKLRRAIQRERAKRKRALARQAKKNDCDHEHEEKQ